MLANKVIVVTGGAGLIGKEFIKTIVKHGGIAILADINIDLANKTKEGLEQELHTSSIDAVQLDITSEESLLKVIDYLDKKYNRIDALVNSAYPRNKNFGKDVFDIHYEDFVENLGLNLGGYFLTSQQFAKYFKKQGYGNIINISSIYGVVAPKFEIYNNTNMNSAIEYAAIKAGLIHMTKYMAKYFKGLNIRVNCLSPGGILNDGQPDNFLAAYKDKCINKGMLNKEDLEGSLVYLLSDMSLYVNGQNIIVDDGFVL